MQPIVKIRRPYITFTFTDDSNPLVILLVIMLFSKTKVWLWKRLYTHIMQLIILLLTSKCDFFFAKKPIKISTDHSLCQRPKASVFDDLRALPNNYHSTDNRQRYFKEKCTNFAEIMRLQLKTTEF